MAVRSKENVSEFLFWETFSVVIFWDKELCRSMDGAIAPVATLVMNKMYLYDRKLLQT